MKNFKKLHLIGALLSFAYLQSAERPPQPPKLPTFGQIVKQAEEKQKKERAAQPLEYARRITPASLQGLPADLQRALLLIIAKSRPALNIYELASSILSLARTDRALRIALNTPANLIAIFNALPYTANAISLFNTLKEQPGTMPVLKNPEIINWIARAKEKLEAGQELYDAVAENNREIVADFLKNKNIDLTWLNVDENVHRTALHLASDRGYAEIVRLLLNTGPSIHNILHSFLGASANGHADVVNQFLIFSKLINKQDNTGRTALMYACANGHTEVVRILLAGDANPNIQDTDGMTALMWAAQRGHEVVVRLLIDAEAKINLQDNNGMTPLMYAAQLGSETIVRMLLAAGADQKLKNKQGKDADNLAMDGHHFEISLLLLKAKYKSFNLPYRR
jgi:ankyrin repeat protein